MIRYIEIGYKDELIIYWHYNIALFKVKHISKHINIVKYLLDISPNMLNGSRVKGIVFKHNKYSYTKYVRHSSKIEKNFMFTGMI